MSPSKSGPYIGRPIPRIEDERLVAGAGRYTDDVALPGQLHAHFVRSPYPHAQIGEIDRRAAAEAAGVIAVLTAEDYTADGLRGIAHRPNPAGAVDHRERAFDPDNVVDLPHWPLAEERARHLGEPVAVIIASTKAQALDAAELLQIDYTPLDAIVAIDDAMATGAPILWEDALGNLCVDETFGDPDEVGRIFEGASHTVRLTFQSSRIVNCQMEPRSAIAASDTETGELNVIAGSQGVIRYRDGLREVLDLPEDRLHVVCPDVGGGFGPRSFLYPEVVVVAWAARRDVIEDIGLYDALVLGCGDKAMASAAYGRFDGTVDAFRMSPPHASHYRRWARSFHRRISGRVGCVDGPLAHFWHGDTNRRARRAPYTAFRRFVFDPKTDLAIDDRGAWQWASDKPELHRYVADSLRNRCLDCDDAPPLELLERTTR
ncbi:MAG: molybdopterin-dependent oxidoreductase [Gemmatimonadales bacterium]